MSQIYSPLKALPSLCRRTALQCRSNSSSSSNGKGEPTSFVDLAEQQKQQKQEQQRQQPPSGLDILDYLKPRPSSSSSPLGNLISNFPGASSASSGNEHIANIINRSKQGSSMSSFMNSMRTSNGTPLTYSVGSDSLLGTRLQNIRQDVNAQSESNVFTQRMANDPSGTGDTPTFAPGATAVDRWLTMYHLHVYSHKHNTHVSFTDPKGNTIITLSAGNLGFRKAQRSTYDAAYQVACTVFQKIQEKGINPTNVELLLRGFGVGREAAIKALNGKEGRFLRNVIKRVTDSTTLKFGGTRSKKPRRI